MNKPLQYYNGICIMADTGLHDQIAEVITVNLPRGSSIMDFGCGQGALSQRLQDIGYHVLSVDVDESNFKAQTEFTPLDFNDPVKVQDFLSKHGGKFDLVLGIEVIEHVENPWQYVRTLSALAKSEGYVLISTPNVSSWYSRVRFLMRGRFHQFEDADRSYGHINPVTVDELTMIVEHSGLSVVKVVPAGWLPRFWYPGSLKGLIVNIFGFLTSFKMKGIWEGWAIICLAKRKMT